MRSLIPSPIANRTVHKVLADMNQTLHTQDGLIGKEVPNGRGLMVYSMSQLMAITGRGKDGQHLTMNFDQSIFYLNFDERVSIYRLCAPVNAVVTSRMNTIAGLEFDVVSDKTEEEKIAHRLKLINGIREDYAGSSDLSANIAAKMFEREILQQLMPYGLLPDLSNFDKAMLRWHRSIQQQHVSEGQRIKEWLMEPNLTDRWEEHIKKIVFDLMIHGACAIYKENNPTTKLLENFYALPGGTVIPLKNKYAGGIQAYFQQTNNVDEPLIYFSNELSYANYIPNTARAYGFVPLEALINMVAESMLFDKLMGDQADGTKPPEKMVVIANASPFGDVNNSDPIPLPQAEQKRIEQKINAPKKNAIMTFTGNTVQVVDLSRENTMEFQHQRQKDITNYIGMVFQATPMEMNLSGSDNTSGRSTSDAQREIYQSKGVMPLLQIIESVHNRDIIPFRFGPGWKIDYKSMKNDVEEMELLQKKMATGIFSVNEVRKTDLNIDPFPDKKFDEPAGASSPDGSTASPLNFKGVGA